MYTIPLTRLRSGEHKICRYITLLLTELAHLYISDLTPNESLSWVELCKYSLSFVLRELLCLFHNIPQYGCRELARPLAGLCYLA